MANGNEKTFDKKFFVYVAMIVFMALVSFFTIKGAIEIDIVELRGNDTKIELQIRSNEVYVKRDIEIIKDDIREMKENDLKEIKDNIQKLIDLRLAGRNSSGN